MNLHADHRSVFETEQGVLIRPVAYFERAEDAQDYVKLNANREAAPAEPSEVERLRAIAERLWEKVNEWRCRLIQWKASGDVSPRDLAELATLQALADDWLSVVAPLPIAELEAYQQALAPDAVKESEGNC